MKLIKSIILNLRIYYYSFLDYLDELRTGTAISLMKGDMQVIERKYQNAKLMRGVKRLVARLRNMTPEARLAEENLLSKDTYKKTRYEVRQELEARRKLLNNPILKTEDDLVMKVVKNAPIYQKHQELSILRKELTSCIKLAGLNPNDKGFTDQAKKIKAKLDTIKKEIERMKNE